MNAPVDACCSAGEKPVEDVHAKHTAGINGCHRCVRCTQRSLTGQQEEYAVSPRAACGLCVVCWNYMASKSSP